MSKIEKNITISKDLNLFFGNVNPVIPPSVQLEDGTYILLEDSTYLKLE